MAGTNPKVEPPVVDDDKPVTEEDLRDLKYPKDGVEPSDKEEDEPSSTDDEDTEDSEEKGEDDSQDDSSEEDEDDSDSETFVKEFPNIKGDTLEEYTKNLGIAYKNSTAEALRLKDAQAPKPTGETPKEDDKPATSLNPTELFVQQELDKKVNAAWTSFQKDYDQVSDTAEYEKFRRRVNIISKAIISDEGRLAEPDEVYAAAAASLNWSKTSQPSADEKLKMGLKDKASNSRTSSGTAKKPKDPQMSEAMLALNRKMYPGKSDAQILKELEEYL